MSGTKPAEISAYIGEFDLVIADNIQLKGGFPGTGTVTSITAGTGLSGGTVTTTGTFAIANTTVTAGAYTLASVTFNAQGQATAASSGSAVTSVTAGTGLSGGTITGTGTIALANTAVTAGSYTLMNATVDAQGRLTAASNGSVSLNDGFFKSFGQFIAPVTGDVVTDITWDTTVSDGGGNYTAGVGGITIRDTGVYQVSAAVAMQATCAADPSDHKFVRIDNSTQANQEGFSYIGFIAAMNNTTHTVSATERIQFTAGDVCRISIGLSSGLIGHQYTWASPFFDGTDTSIRVSLVRLS